MYPRITIFAVLFSLTAIFFPMVLMGQDDNSLPEEAETDRSYRLAFRDLIGVTVFGEPDLAVQQRVDGNGAIRLGLLGNLKVQGLTLRETERAIEEAYVSEAYLRDPQVTLQIMDYSIKEVSVFGQVGRAGPVVFPHERNSMDIVELFSRVGGLSPSARGDRVQVTRRNDQGEDIITEVNVEQLIKGSRRGTTERDSFPILPGDIVFVPERIW